MQPMTKQELKRTITTQPAAIGRGWELFTPSQADAEWGDLAEARAALLQAEAVIRAQEKRIQDLQQLAQTDELTGLTNRRGFTQAFEREIAMARRDDQSSGLLVMIDLDGFKTINDQWGHQAGDAYLRVAADTLRDNVRASDVVARLGGDEFAILLTAVDVKNGAKRLTKLEEAFGKKSLMFGEKVYLRASFGFAAYTGAESLETIMQSADLRLYAHKERNKRLIAAV